MITHPRKMRAWDEKPSRGIFLEQHHYWTHELDFWGGDLRSLTNKIDYLSNLNIDVLYLNPIFDSYSNHKYDATDYFKISEEFGTLEDLKKLIEQTKKRHIKLMLDGVFNHVGVNSVYYQEALKNKNETRNWFDFDKKYQHGVRLWANAPSLPELNFEYEPVKNFIYKDKSSVLKTYLNMGIDGFRLDVAFDLGYDILKEITQSAHQENAFSCIVGEIWNYPSKWLESIDGIMNFTLRSIMIKMIRKDISPHLGSKMIDIVFKDADYEKILKSWIVLDNHDTPRLPHIFQAREDIVLAQVLQFTLPGSPCIYYGTEFEMDGGDDPFNRAPMTWHLANEKRQASAFLQSLIDIHQHHAALKVGDYQALVGNQLFGFRRFTNLVSETIFVVLNFSHEHVSDILLVRDSDIMNYSGFEIIKGEASHLFVSGGILEVTLKPKSFVIFSLKVKNEAYSPYKRV